MYWSTNDELNAIMLDVPLLHKNIYRVLKQMSPYPKHHCRKFTCTVTVKFIVLIATRLKYSMCFLVICKIVFLW